MQLHVMSVFDGKVGAFGTPMFTMSIGASERGFSDEVNRSDPNNTLFNHPEDFILYHLGSWNDDDGRFQENVPPVLIASGVNVKR